jgi:hypothetical protein
LYCETSDFKEARKALEDAGEGSQMQKLWVKTLYLETLAEAKDFAQLCRENLSNVHNKEVWVSEVLSEEE